MDLIRGVWQDTTLTVSQGSESDQLWFDTLWGGRGRLALELDRDGVRHLRDVLDSWLEDRKRADLAAGAT